MISPAALMAARSEALAKEGGAVPLEPKRKWWVPYLLFGFVMAVPVVGCRVIAARDMASSRLSATASSLPASAPSPSPSAPVNQGARPTPVADEYAVEWVSPKAAIVVKNGVPYAVRPGDACDGFTVGVCGVSWVDILVPASGPRRLYVAYANPQSGNSSLGGGAGSAGVAGYGRGGGRSKLSAFSGR